MVDVLVHVESEHRVRIVSPSRWCVLASGRLKVAASTDQGRMDTMSDETSTDPWTVLTAALDAANRDAIRREIGRTLGQPIGGMYLSDGPFQVIPHWDRTVFPIDAPSLTIQQVRDLASQDPESAGGAASAG
ncbi:hypothetical protein [Frankia sp. AgW1.1]|uniref:hypothetical protein n=1 Tax=Frankia sp. AgW1.1 TaxID=1836971 RepID=UPI0019343587|nr:hypothetical protein [Frankia sp. AgW1.1]MBL7487102.1 hypothetical protein [Frankia sp. AgW1.1]